MNNTTRSVIVTLVAIVFLMGTGMVAASPATTKASPLYPIKKAIEVATLAYAAPEDKAAIQASHLEKRVAEIEALKLQIAALEKAQEVEKAKRLQEASVATALVAKETVVQGKADARLITDEIKKKEVLEKINKSSKRIDDEDEDEDEEIEAPEPKETPEPEEEKEMEESKEAPENSEEEGAD